MTTPKSPVRRSQNVLEEGLDETQPAFVGNANGDVKAAIASAAKKIEAVYDYPYQNHAALEPLNATALYTPDKCEVWTGTQDSEACVHDNGSGLRPAPRNAMSTRS